MAKKQLTFSEMLQRQIDKQNKRQRESKAAMDRLLAQYQASKPTILHNGCSCEKLTEPCEVSNVPPKE
jgi:hypothetical protein